MSVYVPNFAKNPLEIMLGLINHDNQKGYAPTDVAFRNLAVLDEQDASGKNTSIEVDLLNAPSEVDGDWVTFYFDRMDLAGIFSTVVTAGLNNVREVEVKTVEGQLDVPAFISEVSRKYGVALNETDFEIAMPTAGTVTVTAVAANYAYTGAVTFVVDAGLQSRVATATLAGFTAGDVDLDPSDDV